MNHKHNGAVQRTWRWGLLGLLAVGLISACSSEAPEARVATERPIVYSVPVGLDITAVLPATAQQATAQRARALDHVVYDETDASGVTNANPHLDLAQFQDPKGIDVNLIFVCVSDDSQPVSIVQTKLYPDSEATTPGRRLRNAFDQRITLAAGTNLMQGSWRMAIYYGPMSANGGTTTVDPNKLEDVKPASDKDSDLSIDKVWNANKGNLKKLAKSTKGATSLTADQKVALQIPYLSDWIDLSGHITQPSTEPHIKLTGVPLYAQGTLLRVRMHNQGFSDIKLAGFRILTNSLSFRGEYDFSVANLRNTAKGGRDLSSLYTERNALGQAYVDSVGRTRAFPSYADFWVKKGEEETLATDQTSDYYYLIWAMPRRSSSDATKSRKGILHLLAYDANRTGAEYNTMRTGDGHTIIPKALIRKPALTRAFGEGFFKLSSGTQAGNFYRFDGVQTPVYNFLDFMTLPQSSRDGGYYTLDKVQSYSAPSGMRVAKKSDWAGIFPTKLPSNPGSIPGVSYVMDHYIYVNNNVTGKIFNSNRYGVSGDERIFDNGRAVLLLTLDESDGNPVNSLTPAENWNKAGKSNNRQTIHIPAAMKVPAYRNGRIQTPTASDEEMIFSTYTGAGSYRTMNFYTITGWGQGQTYLTATAWRPATATDYPWTLQVTSRYLGPAFHRPYAGTWAEQYPWDISFYLWGDSYTGADPRAYQEAEDTHRSLYADGYQIKGVRTQDGNTSDNHSGGVTNYWGAEGDWLYFYGFNINNKTTPSGYGQPGNGPRTQLFTAADKPGALIRLFSDTPVATRKQPNN